MKTLSNIAIVRLSALGDIINSVIAAQVIKALSPQCNISWFCEEAFSPLLERCDAIDSVYKVPIKRIKKTRSLALLKQTITALKQCNQFDVAIDMQGLIKSAIVTRLLSNECYGFDKASVKESACALFYRYGVSVAYEENIIIRNLTLIAETFHVKLSAFNLQNRPALFRTTPPKKNLLHAEKKNVILIIGASWSSKVYPKELLLEVIETLDAHFIAIWGNNKEHADASWLSENTSTCTVAPKLGLDTLVDLVSASDLVIGNDTGPTHLAWAQNIPSIVLLGPTTERMMGLGQSHIALKSSSYVDVRNIDKNDFSIKEIAPSAIVEKAKELLLR